MTVRIATPSATDNGRGEAGGGEIESVDGGGRGGGSSFSGELSGVAKLVICGGAIVIVRTQQNSYQNSCAAPLYRHYGRMLEDKEKHACHADRLSQNISAP